MLLQPLLNHVSLSTLPFLILGFLAILITAYTLYNIFLHPLAHIPGPLLARSNPFVQLYHGLQGDRHVWLHRLHKEYGPHVRVAPNFVSVNSVEGLHDIYGHGKKVQKGQFYNAFAAIKGVYNTHNVIDKAVHGKKRRVLSHAFSDNALKAMESVMLLHIRQLCAILAGSEQKETKTVVRNMADWFSYLSYDIMGELCFGKSYDMLIDGARRKMIRLVDRAAYRHYVCGLWMPLDTYHLDQVFIRRLTNDRWNFIMNGRVEVMARAKARTEAGKDSKKDFFYYLFNAKDPETGEGLSTPELWGEANVLMIAGSDTTSTGLTSTIFYLVRNRTALDTVTKEIRSQFKDVEEIVSIAKLNDLPYLKACIDEALRLAPPVPGAMPREVQAGGAEIDGMVLPAGTNVGTPCYSIHHQEAYFRSPMKFLPERWIEGSTVDADRTGGEEWTVTKEDVELSRNAYCPFSIGPRGCIGKSMAHAEMRLTLARLLFLFDFELADQTGEDANGMMKILDHFTGQKTGPNVTVKPRAV